jgi:hypothetical protein
MSRFLYEEKARHNWCGITKVFKSDPLQSPGSGFWPGRSGQSLFKKNSKRRRFSKKKTKINELQPSFWSGFAGSPGSSGQPAESAVSHRVMAYPIFSLTRPGSSPGSVGSRIDLPGRARFQNYGYIHCNVEIGRDCLHLEKKWFVVCV